MKIENLIVGQAYKYKELCEVLEIKATSKANNSRIAQFKELERYCKYHKKGHSIIIDSINTVVGEKVDNRKIIKENDKRKLGNNNEQAKCIRYLLCNLLSSYQIKENEVIGFSKYILLRKLGMINENYRTAKGRRNDYANALDVSEMAINECFDYLDNNSISAIKRAIQTLKNQSVLGYKYSFTWVDKNGYHHHADTIEENKIHIVEQEVMEQMGIKKKTLIYEYGRWNEFKSRVIIGLKKEHLSIFKGIEYYYSSFHFNYMNEGIQMHMRYMERKQSMSYEVAKEGIKDIWNASLDTTINNRHNKALEIFGEGFKVEETYRKSDTYVAEQTKVKDSIVKPDHQTIEVNEQLTMDIENLDVPF